MSATASFMNDLQQATLQADNAETELQKEIVARRNAIERDRKFAYRRFNFMRSMTDAVASADKPEIAVANAQAAMRNSLGWSDDSESRQAALTEFAPVALAVYASLAPAEAEPPEPDVLGELAAFETRYETRFGSPFWVLFENYIPETPLVDF